MFAIVAKVPVKKGVGEQFEQAFLKAASKVHADEPGCLLYQLCRNKEDDTTYTVVEIYANQEALVVHKANLDKNRSPETAALLAGPPDVLVLPLQGPPGLKAGQATMAVIAEFQTSNAEELEGLSRSVTSAVHEKESGHLLCYCTKHPKDPSKFVSVSLFSNEAAYQQHLKADYLNKTSASAAAAAAAADSSAFAGPPKVEMLQAVGSGGTKPTIRTNRRWMSLQAPTGAPVRGKDIELEEAAVPEPQDGEFLVRLTTLSLDPYMRHTMHGQSVMTGGAVGQIVETKNSEFPLGALVIGNFGWQDYAVSNGKGVKVLPASSGVKPSWYLGVLGMPGATAYYGLLEIGQPKPEDVVLVSACTGAVGALVGQIAKIKGCKVIGMCSTSKVSIAEGKGFDVVIGYSGKSVPDLVKEIKEAAPDGINVFFDNTGGDCSEAALACLARFARVPVCGQIANYNLEDPQSARAFPVTMIALSKQAKIEGFMSGNVPKSKPGDWSEAQSEMATWLKRGRMKVQEDTTEGLENAFDAFLSLFNGLSSKSNVGKKILEIAVPPLPVPGA